MKRLLSSLLVAGFVWTLSGCCNSRPRPITQSQPCPPPSPRPVLPATVMPGPPPALLQGPPPGYPAAPPNAVPPGYPTAPPGANIPPPAPPMLPTAPAPTPPNTGGITPAPQEPIARVENRWQPADKNVQLGAPEPLASAEPKAEPRLYPPDKTPEPPVNKGKAATGLPVGIPQFSSPMDNVATGLRPSLDEGLDWLQARGYRTVVHIRAPGEDDAADRKQVEKRNMKYISLEVAPQHLDQGNR